MSRRLSDYERLQQLLLEAEQRAQDERAGREEAERLAQDERASREEAERRAQDEQTSREEAERRAQDEQTSREEAERRAQDEQTSREEAERRLHSTTLVEYLQLCHQHLFLAISVQPDKSLTSTGGITSPVGKTHPRRLLPWTGFLDQQKATFERLYSAYRPEHGQRVFESEHGVEVQGRRIKLRPVGFEADLQYVQREAVETPATFIINHLSSVEAVSREFKLSGRITFDNQPHAMSDESEEVMQRWSEQNLQPSTPGVAAGGPKPRTDQVCVYTEVHGEGNRRRLAFVIEDKPAHKLSTAMLRMGLRPLDIRKDVIDRVTVPTSEDQEAHIQYHSDRLVAAAITQIFSYMIEGGVQYGYITTGEAIVFLHVPSDDPSTVRYHLVEPRADVEAQIEAYPDNAYSHCTALGQVLAFSLLALESKAKPNDWQQRVIEQLTPWAVDYDAMLREMSPSSRKAPSTRSYCPSTYSLDDRSPIKLRSMTAAGCRPQEATQDDAGSSDSDEEFNPLDTPTRPPWAGHNPRPPDSPEAGGPNSTASRRHRKHPQFCTHDCLQGLAQAGFLDPKCPNVSAHRGHNGRHWFDQGVFLEHLHQQLERTMDSHCSPLGMDGARGALFRVTLASHGYTLVAKGTVRAFVRDLRHEAMVYQHLRALQGVSVPVCLGSIELYHPFYYDVGVRIIHMMLLSWAGRRIDTLDDSDNIMEDPRWKGKIAQAIEGIRRTGILHNDVRPPNILWDDRVGRIMVIDFERSEVVKEPPPLLLSPSSGNKRKRESIEADGLGVHVKLM